MQLSEHFTLSQLDQPAGHGCAAARYPAAWIKDRAFPLAEVLEVVRAELGGLTMTITSGYRTPELNEALRAAGRRVARSSQHCEGRAADIVVAGASPTELHAAALHSHRRGRIRLGGLGLYSGWVHVDIRPGPLSQWAG
jgi:uncharacterized protein YcbK (DUF882 family)